MTVVTISAKGRIVIPNELRKRYGLRTGDKVALVDCGAVISIVPAMTDPVEEAAGSLRGDRSLTRALLAERVEDRARES